MYKRVMTLEGIEVDSDDNDILLVRAALSIYQDIVIIRLVELEIVVLVQRRVLLEYGLAW